MANKKYEENDIASIAASTRKITGTTDTYTVHEMAVALDEYSPSEGGGDSYIDDVQNSMEDGVVVGWYSVPYKITGGGYVASDGTIATPVVPASQFPKGGVIDYDNMIAVLPGEQWRYKGGGIWDHPADGTAMKSGVLFGFDSTKKYISTILSNANYGNYAEFTIPDGVYYITFVMWSGIHSDLQKYGKHYEMTQADKDLLEQLMVLNQTKQRTYTQPRIRKPKRGMVTIVHDDMNYNPAEIAEMFAVRGLKLCWAHTGDFNNVVGTAGDNATYFNRYMTKWEMMKIGESLGFERLQHEGTVITADNIDDWDALYEQFAKRKEDAEWFGFFPSTYILAGGNGLIAGDLRTDKWVRYFYKMSDLYGTPYDGESTDRNPNPWTGNPYFYGRGALSNNNTDEKIQQVCASILSGIESGNWMIFYTHGFPDLSKERLEYLLDFIIEHDIPVCTYSDVYSAYATMDALFDKNIVSISATATSTVFDYGTDVTTDMLGLSVVAVYDDGSTEVVTQSATITVPTLVVGANSIAVSYQGKTTTIIITINDSTEEPSDPDVIDTTITFTGSKDYADIKTIHLEAGKTYNISFDWLANCASLTGPSKLYAYNYELGLNQSFTVYTGQPTRSGSISATISSVPSTGDYLIRLYDNGGIPASYGSIAFTITNFVVEDVTQPSEPDTPVEDEWDFVVEFPFTAGRDQATIQGTPSVEKGKTYRYVFDYKVDATNSIGINNNSIKLYSWAAGITNNTSLTFIAGKVTTGTIDVTAKANNNATNPIVLDDLSNTVETDAATVYIKNLSITEVI